MEELGVAVIGCGAIFSTHAQAIKKNQKAKLICVVDIDEEKAKKSAIEYSCEYYTNYKEMLKDNRVDVVHICTPHYLHGTMITECAKFKKHVIVEKPVGLNYNEAIGVADHLKDSFYIQAVVFQNRLNPTVQKMKEIIDNKSIGNLLGIKANVTWYRTAEYYKSGSWRGKFSTEGGGVLINQSIHTLDLVQWLGGKITSISGSVDNRTLKDCIEVEDTAEARITFNNGAVGLFYATNAYCTNSPVEIEIMFTNGILKLYNNELFIIKDNNMTLIESDRVVKGQKDYWGLGHYKLIDNVYDSIINHSNNYIDIYEASIALQMIKGIYQSSLTHTPYFFN